MSIEDLQEHSPVGPSSGERWMNCPGSVAVTQHMPDVTSEFAAEGTFAHYITELARKEGKDAIEYKGLVSEDGKFECDQEMVDAVQDYLDYCEQYDGDVLVEQRVHYDAWVKNGFGTSDHIALDNPARVCFVNDFKYGKGIQIYAKNNIQLKLYGLGVFQDWGALYEIDKFILAVSQPRLGHRDQWEISTEDLLKWAEDEVVPAAERVYEAVAVLEDMREDLAFAESDGTFQDVHPEYFKAGSHCQWCKIKGECPTRTAFIRDSVLVGVDDLDDLDDLEEGQHREPGVMSNEALGQAAEMIDQIKKWCVDVMDTIQKRVMAGEQIPSGEDPDGDPEYWKMVEGRSNRSWSNEEKAAAALKKARLKVDQIYTRKVITPPAAEKLLGKKHKIFQKDSGYVHKPQGNPVLVKGSDNRKPFKVSSDELDDIDDIDDIDDDDESWLD